METEYIIYIGIYLQKSMKTYNIDVIISKKLYTIAWTLPIGQFAKILIINKHSTNN